MNTQTTNLIETAYITLPGDPPVGIPDRTITVQGLAIDPGCLAEYDHAYHLTEIRAKLVELGHLVSDGKPYVMFDFECRETPEEAQDG